MLIDVHCHLDNDLYKDDIDIVIENARKAGIVRILTSGINNSSNKISIALAKKYDIVEACVGRYPDDALDDSYYGKHKTSVEEDMEFMRTHKNDFAAIGEIGLDYYREFSPRDVQIEIYKQMIEQSKVHNLPVCIHNRDADQDIIRILDPFFGTNETKTTDNSRINGVFHAFNGSKTIAKWGISHNFAFGIGGYITYKKSNSLRESIKTIGLDHLVLETDAPYLAPVPYRGKRNLPQYLPVIAQTIADILSVDFDEVIKTTDENAKRIFGL